MEGGVVFYVRSIGCVCVGGDGQANFPYHLRSASKYGINMKFCTIVTLYNLFKKVQKCFFEICGLMTS